MSEFVIWDASNARWAPHIGLPPPPFLPIEDLGGPVYGFIDEHVRPAGVGYDVFEDELQASIDSPGPISQFMHGYSGFSHPATFALSSVADAQAKGIGAMLNTKLPWDELANGDHDALITGFFNSWPVGVPGMVTVNHEPENDGPDPARSSNPVWVAWAEVNGPLWVEGIQRYINLAAPIIRARGLDVKVGGCLMDFSWNTDRWNWWKWWEGLVFVNLPQTTFGIDAYWKHLNSGEGAEPFTKIETLISVMRSAGIPSFSLWETAVDRRLRGGGDTVIGTQESCARWWEAYGEFLRTFPEMDWVCYFHTPGGPASDQAWIDTPCTATFATLCVNGRQLT